MNLIGTIAFLLEAGLTFLGWRIFVRKKPSVDPKRGCAPQVIDQYKAQVFFLFFDI